MTMDEVLTFNICLCEGPGVWNGAGLAAFGGKGKKLSIIQFFFFFLKCHLNWLWSHCDDQWIINLNRDSKQAQILIIPKDLELLHQVQVLKHLALVAIQENNT